jgi:hypothetical protein
VQVDTNAQQLDANKFFFGLPQPEQVNHMVVFMTGAMPFADGFGGAVYLGWPNPEPPHEPSWQLLGFISNDKPSAIFKLARTRPFESEAPQQSPFTMMEVESMVHESTAGMAQIGIVIEPLQELAMQTPVPAATAATVPDFVLFTDVGTQSK